MKNLFVIIVFALFCSSCDGNKEPENEPPLIQKNKEVLSIKIVPAVDEYTLKMVFPERLDAIVEWGDGTTGKLAPSLSHVYTLDQECVLVVKATDEATAPSFTIEDISAVEEITWPI